jgi:hypothetical protein
MTGVVLWSFFTIITPPASILTKYIPSLGLLFLFLVRIGMGAGEGVNKIIKKGKLSSST